MAGRESGATRERLLASAVEVFAENGYHEATVAEICERAGANLAAVNYHFRSKKNLYTEAWRMAFHRSLEAYPPGGGVPPDAPAEDRLRGRVVSAVARMADPESHEFDIVQKEHANPTGLLAEVVRESIQPFHEQMTLIVRELLGQKATEQHVALCKMSVMAQCFHVMMRQRHHKMCSEGRPMPGPPFLKFSVDVMADHIVRFSLAAIREMRRQIESGELGDLE